MLVTDEKNLEEFGSPKSSVSGFSFIRLKVNLALKTNSFSGNVGFFSHKLFLNTK